MKSLKIYENSSYLIVKRGELLYLYDKEQEAETLCKLREEPPLDQLWEEQLKNPKFCLPCQLLLFCEEKAVKAPQGSLELGLTVADIEKFKEEVLNGG